MKINKGNMKRGLWCVVMGLLNLPYAIQGELLSVVVLTVGMTCAFLFLMDKIKL